MPVRSGLAVKNMQHAWETSVAKPLPQPRVVALDDAEATTVGFMERDRLAKRERFEKMLADKYDSLNDESFQAIVKCQRCGSNEIRWEEKQTRSADEGAPVFCTCLACKNRWVLR
mgnify:CR=1 FL=1